jgi:SAM-dependent methyltransferase
MDEFASGQLRGTAAEIYEAFFVPALFGQFASRTAEALRLSPGDRALDVACGTGAVAREMARRVATAGQVVGLDRNETMLAVARRLSPGIDWQSGRAEALPFASANFDAVACQFGLMFFEVRLGALRELWRVLRPGGRLAVAVWATLERSPGYATLAALLHRLFGREIAAALHAPFVLGDETALRALFRDAGIAAPPVATIDGTARFASIDAWMHTEIKGWTLADALDEDQYDRLLRAAKIELQPFAGPDGRVAFPAPALLVTALRP